MKTILLLISLLFTSDVFAQNTRFRIQSDAIINYLTGDTLSSQMRDSLMATPGAKIYPAFNKYGEATHTNYFPPEVADQRTRSRSKRVNPGEKVPSYVMTSLSGTVFNSDTLKDRFVIMQFQPRTSGFLFKPDKAQAFSNEMIVLKNSAKVVALFITEDKPGEVTTNIDPSQYSFEIIPSGRGFFECFNITTMPGVMILAPDGTLIGYYDNPESGVITNEILNYKD